MNVYVIPVLIHVPAESAEKADEFIEQVSGVFDNGPATIATKHGSMPVLYVNAPENAVTEDDCAYSTQDLRA